MYSQYIADRPYVNQEAKSEDISANRLLKTGMLSATMNATIQRAMIMPIHVPTARKVVLPICFVPRKIRRYIYLAATWA